MEADRRGDLGAASGEVERALSAEAITGDDDLAVADLAIAASNAEHMLEPPAKRRAVAAQPGHFGEHRIARRAVEFLAEQVDDQRVVAKLDQLPAESYLEVATPITVGIRITVGRDLPSRRPTNTLSSLSPSNSCEIGVPCSCHLPCQFREPYTVHVARGSGIGGRDRQRDLPMPVSHKDIDFAPPAQSARHRLDCRIERHPIGRRRVVQEECLRHCCRPDGERIGGDDIGHLLRAVAP